MKTEKSILFACLLNLAFSVFEFIGGLFVGSMAILSDAVHDFADALGIGVSYIFEKVSKKGANDNYTYGYGRYSVMGGVLTILIGSVVVLYNAIAGFAGPVQIHYRGMILFSVVGICVNSAAVFITHKGASMNQRAVSLHMLEDVLGWIVVLVGAVVMYATDLVRIDAIMSVGLAVFMIVKACGELKEMLGPVLEKTPADVDIAEIRRQLLSQEGVLDVHHVHVWSIDGKNSCATMHLVTEGETAAVKKAVREKLKACGIDHVTMETEAAGEECGHRECALESAALQAHHHCHHHHG